MSRIELDGVEIAYDIVGTGARTAVITPGGRYTRDTPGVRQLAQRLADEGDMRVLIWDRPNTGESDLHFDGEAESFQNADFLAKLLRAVNFAPALVVAGSGGAREALLCAVRHPDVVERLFVLWISGGYVSLASLPFFYNFPTAIAAARGGMEAVLKLPDWQEQLARNPRNRGILEKWEAPALIEKMQAWAKFFFIYPGQPVPGLSEDELRGIAVPVTVLRSGASDLSHTRETSERVAALIPGAHLAEPPWGDQEWNDRQQPEDRPNGLFHRWPLLSPQIIAFARG